MEVFFTDPIAFFIGLLGVALVIAIVLKGLGTAMLTKKCPSCAERVKFAATKCKHCGSALA